MEGPLVLPGDPPVTVTLRRSSRARRLSLRISRLDGRVTMTMPARAPRSEAEAFAREKAGWVRRHLAERQPSIPVVLGAELPVEGRIVGVVSARRSGYCAERGVLEVSVRAMSVPAAAGAVLKSLARDRLTAASDRHAAALGRSYDRITLRDTRSRWGSCTSDGGLMYSWRLILAPPPILDYVAAHEVAHLAQMNHSAKFWREVGRLCPDYERHRGWLRQNGETLHRYRFAD